MPIVDLTIKRANWLNIKRADSKWPNLKINAKNELIVIEGEDLHCDAANKFILDRIKLIRCDKFNFIEKNTMDNSEQIFQKFEKVINERWFNVMIPLLKKNIYIDLH